MLASDSKNKKNNLSIRLSESAVFLRTDGTTTRHRGTESRPSMLRGLLTLELVKPTKLTSIEIELQAKTATAWPEGIGARRIEVNEEHCVFHASTVYFRAGKAQSRRTASIGPGIALAGDELDDQEWDNTYLPSDTPRSNDLINPQTEFSNSEDVAQIRSARVARRVSLDNSHYQRTPISHHEDPNLIPIPPYSPFIPPSQLGTPERPQMNTPTSSFGHANATGADPNPAQSLEEFRNSLQSSLRSYQHDQADILPNESTPSLRLPERSRSRRPSMEDVPEGELPPSTPRQLSPPPDTSGQAQDSQIRGRRGSRFSLSSMSSLFDAVRSTSPRVGVYKSRERSQDTGPRASSRRGRRMAKDNGSDSPSTSIARTKEPREAISTLSRVSEILKLEADNEKDSGDGWKMFKKGKYTYPISFSIPGNAPPTMRCEYGSVTWRLRATVHRPGTFKSKMVAHREVIMIACPTEDDREDSENIIVERHWDQQLQYLISISGRSFYIGGTVPVTFTMMPLSKIKIYRISVLIEERVDYYTNMKRIARTDPINRVELLSLKKDGKHADSILPLDSDDVDAFRNSPLYRLVAPDTDISEMASSLMGPGPWTFHQDLKLPHSCALLRFTNRNRRSNIIVTHLLKCVMRVERGDDLHLDSKTGKRKLFDIVVQTPVHILSCRCNPEWTALPKYSESLHNPQTIIPSCPCQVRRSSPSFSPPLDYLPNLLAHLHSPGERISSRTSSDSNASAAETSPVNPVLMRSLTQSANMISTNSQFERLISGQESEIGEAPPAYDMSTSPPIVVQ